MRFIFRPRLSGSSPTCKQALKKLFVREASREEMAAKEQNNAELFDLWKKAAGMKQIKIASCAKDCKKTVGGEITNN